MKTKHLKLTWTTKEGNWAVYPATVKQAVEFFMALLEKGWKPKILNGEQEILIA